MESTKESELVFRGGSNAPNELRDTEESRFVKMAVRPMRYVDLPNTITTISAAHHGGLLGEYTSKTPDAHESVFYKLRFKVTRFLLFAVKVQTGTALTIGGGNAFVTLTPPGSKPNFFTRVIQAVVKYLKCFDSAEQRKRTAEFHSKYASELKAAYGDRTKAMFCVRTVATSPQHRHKGYGTTLVRSVTVMADAGSRATWLCSSNIDNTAFYERCGFVTVREFLMGDDNPTWTKPPIVIRIMGREPQNNVQCESTE